MNNPRFICYWTSPKNLGVTWFWKIFKNSYFKGVRFLGITLVKVL